jgi:hypothetical protein
MLSIIIVVFIMNWTVDGMKILSAIPHVVSGDSLE